MDPDFSCFVQQKKQYFESHIDLEKIKSGVNQYIPNLSYTLTLDKSESSLDFYDELAKLGFETYQLFLQVLREVGYEIEADWLEYSFPNSLHYKMKPESIGSCLIINNVKFSKRKPRSAKDTSENRESSNEDEKILKKVFKHIGYRVISHTNLTAEKMMEKLCDFRDMLEDFDSDSFIVIILTHGYNKAHRDTLYGTDWNPIYKEDIYEVFSNEECKYMQGKPKMFFFQACRGNQYYSRPESPKDNRIVEDEHELSGFHETHFSIYNLDPLPKISDMIVVHSALPDHKCHLGKTGSIFCQKLAEVFQRDYKKYDLNAMLMTVGKEIAEKSSGKEEFLHIEYLGPFGIVNFYQG